jgi:hypothetical protein
MLNITESVSPPESVPSNSWNFIMMLGQRPNQHSSSSINDRNSRNWIKTELKGVPETPSNSGIPYRNYFAPSPLPSLEIVTDMLAGRGCHH